MKKWLTILLLALTSFAYGQGGSRGVAERETQTAVTSGQVLTFFDIGGTVTNQFELLVSGSPATLTTTIAGCMRGGTCSATLGSSSGTANQIVTLSPLNLYDNYKVTVSWTGGTNPSVAVNRTGTIARLGTSGGSLPSGLAFATGATADFTIGGPGFGSGRSILAGNTSGSCITSVDATSTTVTSSCPFDSTLGSNANNAFAGVGQGGTGMSFTNTPFITFAVSASLVGGIKSNGYALLTGNCFSFSNSGANITTLDTAICRNAAGIVEASTSAATPNSSGTLKAAAYQTDTNCASSGGTCTSASSGSVSVAAAATAVTVASTAVTANSIIQLTFDSSLGTKLGVTCNTTPVQPTVSARTAATSFVLTVPTAPTTNPACFNYTIVN